MKHIFKSEKGIQDITTLHQENLLWLYIETVEKNNYQHKDADSYQFGDNQILSLGSKFMQKLFRKKYDGGYYIKILNAYFDCIDPYFHHGRGAGTTRKYKWKP